jgi:hypothetical protein
LPNVVHTYLQELTAKQTIGLCVSHVTPYYATNLFLIIRNLSVLSYFFPLPYQTGDRRKVKEEEEQKEKYKIRQRVHMERVEDNRLPISAIEYRPQGRKYEGRPERR